jgi:hypothetical protein
MIHPFRHVFSSRLSKLVFAWIDAVSLTTITDPLASGSDSIGKPRGKSKSRHSPG